MSQPWTLVTGGAKRLGATLCRTLAARGHSIVLHYNTSVDEAYVVAEQCRTFSVEAETLQGDFSSREGVEAFIQEYLSRFPKTAHLINNVGNYLVSSALKTSQDEWFSLFQTNLHTPWMLAQRLIPSLKSTQGSIVNLGVAGLVHGRVDSYSSVYSLTKSALWTLSSCLAKELASDHVRVNMVSPGHLENSVDLPCDPSELPMGRAATCEEVARVVAFLVDEESSYITGQNIEVAGGVRL